MHGFKRLALLLLGVLVFLIGLDGEERFSLRVRAAGIACGLLMEKWSMQEKGYCRHFKEKS
ncbi:hypothetical protein QR721_10700 [Aciduricibacillus chroicocephali]|uniref:Uncharacterized protein n=1 Tax=Aciduricibacillus chroicocephali TaxID=3054939 RepID=A0ABY9KTQ4_9BACI|nr:hypothetical protein QR721_10700 [Bacillaceae bacterium 44XB]